MQPVPGEQGCAGRPYAPYLDCMRDLEVDLGPALVAEWPSSLPVLLEASRWWCGRSFAHGRAIIAGRSPTALRRARSDRCTVACSARCGSCRGCSAPKSGSCSAAARRSSTRATSATIAARAAAAFADHGPGWPLSVNHSADVQIAAADLAAIEAGEFLVVIGDFHGGTNPLCRVCSRRAFPTGTASRRWSMPTSASRSSSRACPNSGRAHERAQHGRLHQPR